MDWRPSWTSIRCGSKVWWRRTSSSIGGRRSSGSCASVPSLPFSYRAGVHRVLTSTTKPERVAVARGWRRRRVRDRAPVHGQVDGAADARERAVVLVLPGLGETALAVEPVDAAIVFQQERPWFVWMVVLAELHLVEEARARLGKRFRSADVFQVDV
eukprot:6186130-Pleurochrysis_carterae.AAC.1